MKITKKSVILTVIIAIVLYTVLNTFFLVKDFKANLKENRQEPVASNIEVGQIDDNSKRIWKVFAQESSASSHLDDIQANKVKAIIYNNAEQEKIIIRANQAYFNEDKSSCQLIGDVIIEFLESKVTMKTSSLELNASRTININQPVKFVSKNNTSRYIQARSALITGDMQYITLYNIYNSPISPGILLNGGQARFAIKDMSLNKQINISHGVRINNTDADITANNLQVLMNNGQPTRAVFTGNPKAIQGKKILKANIIEYILATKQIKAKGNIKTSVIGK